MMSLVKGKKGLIMIDNANVWIGKNHQKSKNHQNHRKKPKEKHEKSLKS